VVEQATPEFNETAEVAFWNDVDESLWETPEWFTWHNKNTRV
jgi:hypothetical protein